MTDLALIPPDISMALAHDGLRFALASAPVLIDSATGDEVRRALIADYYAHVLAGLEVHHHGEEELLFPLLIERFPDERERVDLGTKQHHAVVSYVAAAETAVSEWGAKSDGECKDVVSALAALEEVLLVHLDYEQAEIVPVEARLSSEDRGIYIARTQEHHMARLAPVAEFFFSLYHGQPLLWEAVGEAPFREMLANVRASG